MLVDVLEVMVKESVLLSHVGPGIELRPSSLVVDIELTGAPCRPVANTPPLICKQPVARCTEMTGQEMWDLVSHTWLSFSSWYHCSPLSLVYNAPPPSCSFTVDGLLSLLST